MEIVHGIENLTPSHQNRTVILGFFDGLHVGHQALIREAGSPKIVYTFDRHPLEIVNPAKAPALLTLLDEKIELAGKLPIETLLIGKFDAVLSSLSPEEFVRDILIGRLAPRTVAAGYSYRYGKNHQGNVNTLSEQLKSFGVPLSVMQPVLVDGTAVSSSKIRSLLLDGKVAEAIPFLGRPYSASGFVMEGSRRGKALGVPTANLKVHPRKLIPKAGVYAGYGIVENKRFGALISIGTCPTFGGTEMAVEAHLLDFNEALYGKELKLEFIAWRRDQETFRSPQLLVGKMEEDIAWGKGILAS